MRFHMVKKAAVSMLLAFAVSASVFVGTFASAASYKDWQQGDSEWGTMQVGSSGETMRAIGCAITSTAILMVRSGAVTDPDFTPGKLLTFLNQAGAFSAEGDLNWKYVEKYGADFAYYNSYKLAGTQAEKTASIRSWLDNGYYVMVNVKNGQHFVAVDEVVGDTVRIMDPAGSATDLFGAYPASGVIGIRVFKISNPGNAGAASDPPTPGMPAPPFSVLVPTDPPAPDPETPPAPFESVTDPTNPPAPDPETPPAPALEPVTEPQPEPVPETPPIPEQPEISEEPATEPPSAVIPEEPETPPVPSIEDILPPEEGMLPPQVGLEGQMYISFGVNASMEEAVVGYMRPDTASEELFVLPEGAELRLTLVAEDFSWGLAEYDGQLCWVQLEHVKY